MTDLGFIKSLLPEHYTVQEKEYPSQQSPGKVYFGYFCKSPVGIRLNEMNEEDQEQWSYIEAAIKQRLGKRLSEIYHITNHCHVNFVVYTTSN